MVAMAPELVNTGYVSVVEAEDKFTEEIIAALIKVNLLQVRYASHSEVWASDLPAAARAMDVLTPYLPVDRSWLRNMKTMFAPHVDERSGEL